ncbi:glycosyltransferase involved in cell wall biosynthesis [Isoptericola jiangsuensis]|uniref:D-inositol 3-phosphate glycosyltransferase n=1 Tax=Isoptericola jiangsuensis TaxID=548579 RepID=A0A2A9F113_9MICO|nr:glycosyltransferase [Isoptericola jiangsuensis]PFG44232.1 glycosyltransferase involved in cell wall biosynthesis [Isoptericola jiangsuensis]
MTAGVALAHDYATQRGGAERVALLMARAFPGSPMYTTLYDPDGTHPEFADVELRPGRLDRFSVLRRHHRLALPLLAPAVDAQRVEADVLLASSSGWAHGYRGARRTVVYCYAPARWLYQPHRYLGGADEQVRGLRDRAVAAALAAISPALRRWDARAAERADRYVTTSTEIQRTIRRVYGIEAEVVPPPAACRPDGPETPLAGVEPGYLLCVARLLPYKNVDVVVEAAGLLGQRLVVVGGGPDRARLEEIAARTAPGLVTFAGRVDDAEMRWAYRHAAALVAASYEDYGLTPLEAGAFGVPTAALRAGGFLDTVVDGRNGRLFAAPVPQDVAEGVADVLARTWSPDVIQEHCASFGEDRFVSRLQEIVAEELSAPAVAGGAR